MEYKTILRPYDLTSLIGNARGKSRLMMLLARLGIGIKL